MSLFCNTVNLVNAFSVNCEAVCCLISVLDSVVQIGSEYQAEIPDCISGILYSFACFPHKQSLRLII